MRGGALWSLRNEIREPVDLALAELLGDRARGSFLGLIDGTAVGYGLVHAEAVVDRGSIGIVDELYVEPEARGVGLGEIMLEQLLEWCRQRGCSGVEATALPGDRQTKNLFERSGLVARAITVHRDLGGGDPS